MKNYEDDRDLLSSQGVDLTPLDELENLIRSGVQIPREKHKPHKLNDSKHFQKCYECHVTSPTDDWVVVYKIVRPQNKKLEKTLVFVATGSHSHVFRESMYKVGYYDMKNSILEYLATNRY